MSEEIAKDAGEEVGTALIELPKVDTIAVFTKPDITQPLLDRIRKEALALVPDTSTPAGRSQIRQMAAKIAKTKTYIDGVGKEIVDDMKSLPKQIDAGRKQFRDYLDALKEEVRKPLTEWEAEQERVKAKKLADERAVQERNEAIQRAITAYQQAPLKAIGKPAAEISIIIGGLDEPEDAKFGDRLEDAKAAYFTARDQLDKMFDAAQALEAQQQAERDRQVAEDAARKAREEAESKIIQARIDAERAEQERAAAEQRAKEAEAARQRAVQDAADRAAKALEEAEAARIKAAQEADRRAEEARQQEVQRQAAEAKARADEEARRKADLENRKKIHHEVLASMKAAAPSADEEVLKDIVRAMARGNITHVSITY